MLTQSRDPASVRRSGQCQLSSNPTSTVTFIGLVELGVGVEGGVACHHHYWVDAFIGLDLG